MQSQQVGVLDRRLEAEVRAVSCESTWSDVALTLGPVGGPLSRLSDMAPIGSKIKYLLIQTR